MKDGRKLTALLLCVILMITVITSAAPGSDIYAADQIGVVVDITTTLNVRSNAGTSYPIVGSLKNGNTVTILGSKKASDNTLWYNISYISGTTTIKGYVISSFLQIVTSGSDPQFETYLTAQKFPESYKPYLRALHTQYPNWIFQAFHTNLKWETVLDAESIVGKNLVPISSIASWKSFEKGAYDWNNQKWYGLDGNDWVAASREIIAYCLDPRNGLDPTSIFQFETLSRSSYHSVNGVKTILKNTFMSGTFKAPDTGVTYSYADTFMKAAEVSGVSPYHLASRARQEQGVNGSVLAHGTVPGYSNYFNFFNIGAYSTSSSSSAVNGAIYAKKTNSAYYLPWTNQYKSILGGAVFLGSSYINQGQDTLYLQKFDVVDGGNGYFNHQYMTNVLAPANEAKTIRSAYSSEMLSSTLVFSIPVYLNMPNTAMPKPTSTGDNNNFLASLSIAGQSLTPTFHMYTQNYELVVPNNITTVTINAAAKSSAAKISGSGSLSLKEGTNYHNITVTAASGVSRNYTLEIYRTPGGSSSTPVIKSTKYNIGTNITGIPLQTSAAAFLSGITVTNGSAKLVTASGTAHTGILGTGNVLQIYNTAGKLYASYPIVLYGDVNGDGQISALDILMVQQHLLSIKKLNGPYLTAADIDRSGSVSALDLLRIQQHLLKISFISQ